MPALCFFSERNRPRISFSVRSGSLATRSSSHCLCLSIGERLWPVPGLASTLPVVVQRSIQRIAVEAPILKSRAASRALSPASTIANTRTLRSLEYPFVAIRWIERWTTTGSVDAKPGTGHSRSPFERHKQWLLDLVEREPDLTLKEIRGRLRSEKKHK